MGIKTLGGGATCVQLPSELPEFSQVASPSLHTHHHNLSMDKPFAIDEYRPMRVAIIGAGASGILAGIR